VELDAAPSKFERALQGFGMGRLLSRRKSSTPTVTSSRKTSDPVILTGGPTGRPDWALGHIPEAGESRLEIQEIPNTTGLGAGLTNAGLRELSLGEREAYARKDLQEREYAQRSREVDLGNQRGDLLRDVDLGP